MTVLEFISHLEWGVSVHISKFAPNYYAKSVRGGRVGKGRIFRMA